MEEGEQKTVAQATDHPKGDKLEAEGLSGVQTFMEITEDRLVEVQIDECLPITSAERLGR